MGFSAKTCFSKGKNKQKKKPKRESSTWQCNESPLQRMDPTDIGANQPTPEKILNYSCRLLVSELTVLIHSSVPAANPPWREHR